MARKGRTKLNIIMSLLHQLIMGVCALVLPRFILSSFGSETNGLLQSVSQILSYTTLMEMGIGGVILASLYKPLAENNKTEISCIFNTTKRFFGKISVIFVVFSIVFSLIAKFVIRSKFDFVYVCGIVLILAINVYFNYYFGLPHQLLLKADRRLYIVQSVQIVTTVLNLVVCIIAIKLGASVHIVKLVSAFVFILNPIFYRFYVKKHYDIVPTKEEHPLGQKKDATLHHLAYFIHRNTDIVIISLLSSLSNASVYSVYNAVVLTIENLLNAISAGVAGTIGNILAKGEKKTIKNSFDLYERVNTFLTTAIFTVSAIVIIPFVKIYTAGITDANYIQPIFAYFILAAGFMYCVRIPYVSLASTAGCYKETKMGAIGEVVINLTVSLALIKPLGLTGVAVGTFAAMSFRTGYMVWYLSRNIIKRPVRKFVESFVINTFFAVMLIVVIGKYMTIATDNFVNLIVDAVIVSAIVFTALAIVNMLLNINLFIHKKTEN